MCSASAVQWHEIFSHFTRYSQQPRKLKTIKTKKKSTKNSRAFSLAWAWHSSATESGRISVPVRDGRTCRCVITELLENLFVITARCEQHENSFTHSLTMPLTVLVLLFVFIFWYQTHIFMQRMSFSQN